MVTDAKDFFMVLPKQAFRKMRFLAACCLLVIPGPYLNITVIIIIPALPLSTLPTFQFLVVVHSLEVREEEEPHACKFAISGCCR